MDTRKLTELLHVIGNFAILVGLVIVAYEIRQNSVIARAELAALYLTNWSEIDRSRQDAEFAAVLAKSMDRHEDLTLDEMVQLDGYLYTVINQLNMDRSMYRFGIFRDPLQGEAAAAAQDELNTPFAQAWWASFREEYNPVTGALIDTELRSVPSDKRQKFFEEIKSRLVDQDPP